MFESKANMEDSVSKDIAQDVMSEHVIDQAIVNTLCAHLTPQE
jgi:hypothetical protein